MTQEELIEFLSKNLTIEISHPKHNVGYYNTYMKEDEHNITVAIKLCGELICENTSH